MKKIFKVCIVMIFCLALVGCQYDDFMILNKVEPPKENPSIFGRWIITEYRYLSDSFNKNHSNINNNLENKIITFNSDVAIFTQNTYKNPKYKLKIVDSKEYFENKYDIDPLQINIKNEKIDVITVYSEENYIKEIIQIDNDNAIFESQGIIYFLKRADKEDYMKVKEKPFDKGVIISNREENKRIKPKQSGVLIGLRSLEDQSKSFLQELEKVDENVKISKYRTFWISYDGEINEIKEIPYIFMPRKNGFWTINSTRKEGEKYFYDVISAAPLGKDYKEKLLDNNYIKNNVFYIEKNIDFISNDYITLESIEEVKSKDNNEIIRKAQLNTIPIDTIYSGDTRSIKISEILDKNSIEIIEKNRQRIFRDDVYDDYDSDSIQNFSNFGISRKAGKWVLKCRINLSNNDFQYKEFETAINIPESLLKYDSIFAPWSRIKQDIPKAKDVFSSPNKDIAIVVTEDSLLVYPIKGDAVGESPINKIDLKDGEKVIMAEWSTGEYVGIWDRAINKSLKEKK